MTDQEPTPLVVGRVVKPHGVHGELVVEIRTDSPELRFVPGAVLGVRRRGTRSGAGRPESLVLAAVRQHAGRLLVRAEGVAGRESAEDLRGVFLTVGSDELKPVEDPDEFHDHELEGLRVVLNTGDELGVVDSILHTPGGELLQVRTSDEREVLVPFVEAIVPDVDLARGRVVVDPPEGLLD